MKVNKLMTKDQMETRTCKTCSEIKPVDLFSKSKFICKICKAINAHNWYVKNRQKIVEKASDYYYSVYTASEQRQHSTIINAMLQGARKRAERKGIEFSLVKADIVIPEICPVLGIKITNRFQRKKEGFAFDSPSIDRKDNSKGYTKENIRIVSARANNLKNNGTLEEFKAIVRYMESE